MVNFSMNYSAKTSSYPHLRKLKQALAKGGGATGRWDVRFWPSQYTVLAFAVYGFGLRGVRFWISRSSPPQKKIRFRSLFFECLLRAVGTCSLAEFPERNLIRKVLRSVRSDVIFTEYGWSSKPKFLEGRAGRPHQGKKK